MSLLHLICKELGIEIGEEWWANDGKKYVINKEGSIFEVGNPMLVETTQSNWKRVVRGDLQPVWKPEWGEVCYKPLPDSSFLYEKRRYSDYTELKELYNNGSVFRTKEEAIEAAEKMLKAIKEG